LKSLEIKEKIGNKKGILESYGNVAIILQEQGKYKEAIQYFKKAIKLANDLGNERLLSINYNNLGDCYLTLNNNEEALECLQKSLELSQKLNFQSITASSLNIMGKVYYNQKKYKKAKIALLNGIEIAQKIKYKPSIQFGYEILAQVEEATGNYEEALKAHKLYKVYSDSLFNEAKSKQIATLEIQYETEKKEQKILNLSKENQIKSLNLVILGIVLVLLTLLGLVLYLIYRQKRTSLIQKNQEIEQKLLRLQINPHFIFNVMTAIQEYMFNKDSQKAGVYLSKFSKLMRQVLENSRNEYISIEQEVDMLENYLTLQNLIQEDKFEYDIQVAEELLEEEVAIPPMFAQPFVENAIIHGISELTGKGKIEINFSKKEKGIELEIMDNGIGIKKSLTIDKKRYNSLATQITKERIELFKRSFKKDISFNIQSLKQGTLVLFNLPYKHS